MVVKKLSGRAGVWLSVLSQKFKVTLSVKFKATLSCARPRIQTKGEKPSMTNEIQEDAHKKTN